MNLIFVRTPERLSVLCGPFFLRWAWSPQSSPGILAPLPRQRRRRCPPLPPAPHPLSPVLLYTHSTVQCTMYLGPQGFCRSLLLSPPPLASPKGHFGCSHSCEWNVWPMHRSLQALWSPTGAVAVVHFLSLSPPPCCHPRINCDRLT